MQQLKNIGRFQQLMFQYVPVLEDIFLAGDLPIMDGQIVEYVPAYDLPASMQGLPKRYAWVRTNKGVYMVSRASLVSIV